MLKELPVEEVNAHKIKKNIYDFLPIYGIFSYINITAYICLYF
jgi:hypothetical protein